MTRYKEDFKWMIVELNQTGRPVRCLSKEYGLSEGFLLLFIWCNMNVTMIRNKDTRCVTWKVQSKSLIY